MMVRGDDITSYWTVGFTGHRSLADPERIAEIIRVELTALGGKVQGKLAAVSSIASGGDTLFVEEALKLRLPWIALLPFPRDEFGKDFQPAEWEKAVRCLSNAIVEEVWSATPDRPNAYHDLGIKMIDECDVLIAVWDGETSRGRGGAADMVEYARQRKTPLIWIHAHEGTVVRERFGDRTLRDPILERLLALPVRDSEADSQSPLDSFFHRMDAAATAHLPRVRSRETQIVLLNAVAAFIAAFAMTMGYNAFDFVTLTVLAMSCALLLMFRLHFPKARKKFVQARLAAEICRSLRATRDFPDRLTDLYRSSIPEFDHMIRSLLLARDIDKGRIQTESSLGDLASFCNRYLDERIRNQHLYYRTEGFRSLPRAKRYTLVSVVASSAAVLATLVLAGMGLKATGFNPFPATSEFIRYEFLGKEGVVRTAAPDSKPLAVLGIGAPLIASFFTALLAVNEYSRRSARYREMEQLLCAAELRLTHAITPRAIKQVIVDTETALLGENYQWYYQAGV